MDCNESCFFHLKVSENTDEQLLLPHLLGMGVGRWPRGQEPSLCDAQGHHCLGPVLKPTGGAHRDLSLTSSGPWEPVLPPEVRLPLQTDLEVLTDKLPAGSFLPVLWPVENAYPSAPAD